MEGVSRNRMSSDIEIFRKFAGGLYIEGILLVVICLLMKYKNWLKIELVMRFSKLELHWSRTIPIRVANY